jgi:hypothetical protein
MLHVQNYRHRKPEKSNGKLEALFNNLKLASASAGS